MQSRRILSLAFLCISICGCVSHRKKAKPEAAAPRAEAMIFSGTISLVNQESHFVLIETGYSATPSDGALLKSYTGGTESADLIVSAERRRPFVIADIVRGNPQKGDRVTSVKPAVLKPAAVQAAAGVSGLVQ